MLLTNLFELLGYYMIIYIPLFVILIIVDRVLKKRGVKCFITNMSFIKKMLALMFAVYLYMLVYMTLFDNMYMRAGAGGINLVPFSELHFPLSSWDVYSLVANVVLFVPLGFFVRLFWQKTYISLLVHFLISVCIEIIQIFIGRTCDVDDVICNTLGGVIGICFCAIVLKIKSIVKKCN